MEIDSNAIALDKPCALGTSCQAIDQGEGRLACNVKHRQNDNGLKIIKADNGNIFKKRNWQGFKAQNNRYESLGIKHVKEKSMIDIMQTSSDSCSWKCCQCLPKSSAQLMNDDILNARLLDVLALPRLNNKYPWTRLICDARFVWNQRFNGQYVSFTKDILSHARITKAIQDQIKADQELHPDSGDLAGKIKLYESKTQNIFKRMSAQASLALLRFTGWFLFKLFKSLLNSLVVHSGQMYVVQQTCKKDRPVIFLPIHRSHLDYILLSFILFNFNARPPYVAAGDNLILPFFGQLMRKLGGFFIRRRMEESKDKRDFVYRAVLHTYVEELLKQAESLEFFIEGGRSRSGKSLMPKTGLLSIIVDAYLQGVVEDVAIVPVSISYEKLPERNFVDEQLGLKKKRETFWGTAVEVYRTLFSFYGSVRVDFSQPFSLKEYVDVCQSRTSSSKIELTRSYSDNFITSSADNKDGRELVHSLASHIAYDQARIHSVSSTSLMAWCLLYAHRQGTSMEDLLRTFDSLRGEVTARNHGLSFSGPSDGAARYALSLLGSALVKATKDRNGREFVKPAVKVRRVIELSYYANAVNMVFCLDGVIANSIFSLCDLRNKTWHDEGSSIIFKFTDIVEDSLKLLQLLKYEFIFIPACGSIESSIHSTMNLFMESRVLCKPEELDGSVDVHKRKIMSHLEEPHDPSDSLVLNSKTISVFLNLKNVLGPTLETYHVTSTHLDKLLPQDMDESEFVDIIHLHLKQRADSGAAEYGESACLETLKNCIKGLQECQVLGSYDSCNVRMIGLLGDFQSPSVLEHFVAHLATYRN